MMKYRDLEIVRQIIKSATDLDISYAYDDLVFPEHAAFIIQYDDKDENNFFCYFHKDCIPEDQEKILANLKNSCKTRNCTLQTKGSFFLNQKDEQVEIKFLTK